MAIDIRLIAGPHTQSDPKLKTEWQYTNLSVAEVRAALVERGYHQDQLPHEGTDTAAGHIAQLPEAFN